MVFVLFWVICLRFVLVFALAVCGGEFVAGLLF